MINQPKGSNLQIPRELILFFKDDPGLQRAVVAFLQFIVEKLNNSSVALSEVEQRSGIPAMGRLFEQQKEIDAIVRSAIAPLKGRIAELEKALADINKAHRR